MPTLASRDSRRIERITRKKNNTRIAVIASIVVLAIVIIVAIVILLKLPQRVNANEVDTVFPLSENAVKTSSGLVYDELVVGEGPAAKAGDTVSIIYTGYMADGQIFDSNVESGQPYEFILGAGTVIQGWDEGIVGMQAGGARLLVVPPSLATGALDPFQVIPENTTLTYSITLKEIK